jgi:polysaccharide deacetylase family protein (PEP-CTERM system associated)
VNTGRLLDLLDAGETKATFFVLGYVARVYPNLVREIASRGHEIALHGFYHYRVNTLTPFEFKQDVLRGLEAITDAADIPILGYRAPMFSINGNSDWALEILSENRFRYDSSYFPVRTPWYGNPNSPRQPHKPIKNSDLIEFPLTTLRMFGINWPLAGGFYLRVLPYWLFKHGLEKVRSEGIPTIVYIHPWDLDPDHPRPNPTLRERFTHYYNLDTTESKLKRLLRDFSFRPLKDLLPAAQADLENK